MRAPAEGGGLPAEVGHSPEQCRSPGGRAPATPVPAPGAGELRLPPRAAPAPTRLRASEGPPRILQEPPPSAGLLVPIKAVPVRLRGGWGLERGRGGPPGPKGFPGPAGALSRAGGGGGGRTSGGICDCVVGVGVEVGEQGGFGKPAHITTTGTSPKG